MNPESSKFLRDILDSIEMIEAYLTGIKSFSEYTSNLMLIDAIERRLSIIGEALWKISKLNPEFKFLIKKRSSDCDIFLYMIMI